MGEEYRAEVTLSPALLCIPKYNHYKNCTFFRRREIFSVSQLDVFRPTLCTRFSCLLFFRHISAPLFHCLLFCNINNRILGTEYVLCRHALCSPVACSVTYPHIFFCTWLSATRSLFTHPNEGPIFIIPHIKLYVCWF